MGANVWCSRYSGDPSTTSNLANRSIIAKGNSFSFTVPSGANNTDIGFSGSIVNIDSGSQTTENFALRVDNTMTSTIANPPAVAASTTSTDTSNGGGGIFNVDLLVLIFLAYGGGNLVRRINVS